MVVDFACYFFGLGYVFVCCLVLRCYDADPCGIEFVVGGELFCQFLLGWWVE